MNTKFKKKKNQSVCVCNTDIHNGVREWVGIQYVYSGHTFVNLYRLVCPMSRSPVS